MTMQSSNDSKESGLGDRLSDFENLLKYTADDHSAMQNVFRTIRELLAQDHDAEAELRRLVDQTHADGELDDRTYLTIKRMLDRVVFDFHATMPEDDQDYVNTHVISQPSNEPDTLAERLQAGSVLRDRFLLQRKVAGGSMGVVYKALDRRLAEVDDADPWVAIKVLTPKLSRNAVALRAMQQEAAKDAAFPIQTSFGSSISIGKTISISSSWNGLRGVRWPLSWTIQTSRRSTCQPICELPARSAMRWITPTGVG